LISVPFVIVASKYLNSSSFTYLKFGSSDLQLNKLIIAKNKNDTICFEKVILNVLNVAGILQINYSNS